MSKETFSNFEFENFRYQFTKLDEFVKYNLLFFFEKVKNNTSKQTLDNLKFPYVCEIPINSFVKYEQVEQNSYIDRIMPYRSVNYYGYLKNTFAQDQDPVDACIWVGETRDQNIITQNTHLDIIPFFLIQATDGGQIDSKILGVPTFELENKKMDEFIKHIDFTQKIVKTLIHFHRYKGNKFIINKIKGFQSAIQYILDRKI